jgi:hypothetical protein
MRFTFSKPKPLSVKDTVGGFYLFFSEMERLGLWPEMTEEKKERSLEYAEVHPQRGPVSDSVLD